LAHFSYAALQTIKNTIAVRAVAEKIVGLDAFTEALHAGVAAAATLVMDGETPATYAFLSYQHWFCRFLRFLYDYNLLSSRHNYYVLLRLIDCIVLLNLDMLLGHYLLHAKCCWMF
jgi:hypothetical protein